MTSSIQMSMMNSPSVGTLFEPVFGRRMPSYSENMAAARLPQLPCAPGFMGQQYDGAYFSYKAQGKEMTTFPAPWSSTESSVVDRRSPVTHLSGIDRLHIHRKDSSSEETHPTHKNSPTKQGFTLYTKSPSLSSPQSAASVIVRNDQSGGDRVSTDRPVYLTVPQAVYRHSPCCTDLCCVIGHGSPSLSNQVYEHSWKMGEPGETLLQQRRLHSEGMSLCSPGQTRTLPAVLDQTYSPTKVKEMSHSLQCSPRAYPSLYPSQSTYEPVIYHNRSPISKYGQAPQHPAFYYSPTNVEVEKRTESKNSGSEHTQEVPVVLKHPIQPPGDHYMATTSLPRIEAMPNPAFLPFNYSGYLVPRLNLNTSAMHTHLKHPRTVHSGYIDTSPKRVHRPIATLPSIHRNKSTQNAEHSSPFARVEQTSPTTCSRKSAIPTSSTKSHSTYCPPEHRVHPGPPGGRVPVPGAPLPIVAPAHLGLNMRPPRHHAFHVQPHLRHPHISPTHTILSNKTNKQKILYCPPIPVLTKSVPNRQPSDIHKGPLKRAISSSSPIKIPDEDDDVYVVESDRKRQKIERCHSDNKNKESSPLMPVINNVFSLAPYQTYLQLARLRLGALPQRPAYYSSNQGQAQLTNEDVRQQTAEFKDIRTGSAATNEVLNVYHAKHLDRCVEPAGHCKDFSSDPPALNLTIKRERPESVRHQARSNCAKPATPPAMVKVKQEQPEEPSDACAAVSKSAQFDFRKERPNQEDAEPKNGKKEQDDPMNQSGCSELLEYPEQLKIIKKEPEEIDPPDNGMTCKQDFEHTVDAKLGSECGQKLCPREVTPTRSPPPALSTPPHPDGKLSFLNIPPQCLKLSTYNIILPEANLPRKVQISPNKSPTQPPTCPAPPPSIPLQMPVRKHFFELHQSLVKLISKSVAATSEETLKSWLSRMELNHLATGKSQKVSCLFGATGREACLNEEMKSSLQQVVQRLNEYMAQELCPFPFVVRTGAIFLPMLVVKEVLFPSVHGALIDQVLQQHRVELRPTTLSEEKTLIQMHKRPCSSRLRRLMSLKHLPDVYADVVNLLYYTCVCKQLGLEIDDSLDADEPCAEPNSSSSSPPAPSPSPHRDAEQLQTKSLLRRSRVKRSSRRFFLDGSSDEEQQTSSQMDPTSQPSQKDDGSNEDDNSWMCPLTTDADAQGETSNMQRNFEPSATRTFQEKSKSCPGVILKLRRTCNRKRLSYRPVLDSERLHLDTEQPDAESSQQSSGDLVRKAPEIARWKRTSHSLRPHNAYSKKKLRSLLRIKYCPYLSACHSADYRRRWVLRSAVQRARRAMKISYPDLVGKRIQHLYEEDDKSEVWYRGEVLQVHKANPNPLKTVFEVRYDSEPEWKYYLELLIDYKKGWLKIEE